MQQDTGSMAIEVRVKYLEQLTRQLGEQVKVMKQLVSAEVTDLKTVMQLQIAEVKQIVMHQDRVYQERIHRLETRIEQLSEFSMQLARSTGSTGVLKMPSDGFDSPVANASPTTGIDDDEEEEGDGHDVDGIKKKYKQKIDAIYRFYTTSNIQVFHPAMTIAHFAKLCRDCHLNDFNSGTTTELLWMSVMRRLGNKRKQRSASSLRKATGIVKKLSGKHAPQTFAYERLDEIPEQAFADALYALAVEKIGKDRIDLTPATMFETFLLTDIFPNTDARMDNFQVTAPLEAADRAATASESIAAYKTEAVEAVMHDYMARIRDSFKQCSTHGVMTLDNFVEFVRRHDIMPVISKPDIRAIYVACAAIEKNIHPTAKADTISLEVFKLAIYHLADRIYGDALYVDKYPNPEARVRKLLAKMFLLRGV